MLPTTRVVLFKHGVGYFQRTGTLEGNQRIELGFKSSQMNDVLKSLTALDFDGGTFAALSYDSEEPVERRLAELNMDIPDKGAIAAFLDQLKGARVAVPHGDDALEGRIMGIEAVERVSQAGVTTEPHLAVLAEEGRMVRVPLLEILELHFLDEGVRKDLQSLLDIRFSSLRKDRKRLSIQTLGQGKRRISLSYVIEAPVWKTSYRLILPARTSDKPLLQGWALIDNTTEDDWDAVNLSLVAGLPISFIHDLYTPRYRNRPIVEVQEEAVVAPPVVEAGMAARAKVAQLAAEEAEEGLFDMDLTEVAAAAPSPAARQRQARTQGRRQAARSSVQVHTRTQEVGDLFAYQITQPVTVARGRSALVPIMQSEPDAERVVLYNPEVRDKNPLTAFRIKNTTDLTLEGGPITVFEGDDYVGEAMLDTLRRQDERITPYSVELGITVQYETEQVREDYTKVTKRGQYIYKHYRQLLVTEYRFHSRLERPVNAYLDHRFRYNHRINTPEPVEETEHFWRFKRALPARAATSFRVTEVHEQTESIHIPALVSMTIYQLFSDHLISEAVKAELEAIADQAAAIRQLEDKFKEKHDGQERITKGQKRLRDNLGALGNTTEEARLRARYVSKLAKEEEQLERLQKEAEDIEQQLEARREELNAVVESLELR